LKVLVVIHEATYTGAPKVGGLIASALLRNGFDVKVVVLRNGPLRQWLSDRVGPGRYALWDRGKNSARSFEERVALAADRLKEHDCDIVYVNSLASSEFLVAANATGKKSVLHLHEKSEEMYSLLRQQVTQYNIGSFVGTLILAGTELGVDFCETFGVMPPRVLDWGVAVDVEEIERLASQAGTAPKNITGERWRPSARLCIGMVGHGSPRKGADIFLELAQAHPEADFLWVGHWDYKHKEYLKIRPENLFYSGNVPNPYRLMKQFDLLVLSSREDPNPLILTEAMLLRVPVMAFSRTTAVTDFLGRNVILVHGYTNVGDASRLIAKFDKTDKARISLCPPPAELRNRFDITRKIGSIAELLRSISG
jgi:glycosyltransferase involved in cell wall biosynthesis